MIRYKNDDNVPERERLEKVFTVTHWWEHEGDGLMAICGTMEVAIKVIEEYIGSDYYKNRGGMYKWVKKDDLHWTSLAGTTGIDIKEEKVFW